MANTELQIDSMGKYFVKELIDIYGPKVIDKAVEAYLGTIELLKVGITAPNNLAINVFSELMFCDLLHGGQVKGIDSNELAAMHDVAKALSATDRDYMLNLFAVDQSQLDKADFQRRVVDQAVGVLFTGQRWVFYQGHDRRYFPKLVSDAAFEKVLGYGDILLKGQSLAGIGGGIKTFVEAAKTGAEAFKTFEQGAAVPAETITKLLSEANKVKPTIPLPTSEGANQ